MAETVSLPATASRVPWRSIGVALVIIALLVAAENRRWTAPLLLAVGALTLAVAVALVYANYHWLSDTVGSILLGVGLLPSSV